jgi:hypothetical protein
MGQIHRIGEWMKTAGQRPEAPDWGKPKPPEDTAGEESVRPSREPEPEGTKSNPEEDAKHGTVPHDEVMQHLKSQGIHDIDAAQTMLHAFDSKMDDLTSPNREAVKRVGEYEPGDVVMHPGWDHKGAPLMIEPDAEWVRKHINEVYPTAKVEGDKAIIPIAGKMEEKPLAEVAEADQQIRTAHRKWARPYNELHQNQRGSPAYKVVKHTAKGTQLQPIAGGNNTTKTVPHEFPMAAPANEHGHKILRALADGTIERGGDPLSKRINRLPPAVRHTIRQMTSEDVQMASRAATVGGPATEAQKKDAAKVSRMVDAMAKHRESLAEWGVGGAKIHVHPNAVVLSDDQGNEYAKVGHDLDYHRPSVKQQVKHKDVQYHDEPAQFRETTKSIGEWTAIDDDGMMLKSLFALAVAPRPPAGYDVVLLDPETRTWQAYRSAGEDLFAR